MVKIDKAPSLPALNAPLTGGTVKLHGRIEVDLDARLPAFDAGSGYAYEAADRGDKSRSLYAMVCDPRVPYRHRPAAVLRGKNNLNYVSVVTAGRISPTGSAQTRIAVVLDRPKGVSLAALLSEGRGRGERWIREVIVPQAWAGLSEIHGLGITHRALRPDNVFFSADDGTLALGQCVTVPAGALQPEAFEPLESAAAMADGRGDGTPAYDAFALGALLLWLSAGGDASAADEDGAQLVSRMINGSYATLAGSHKITGPFSDLIKGLLCDSPDARWGLEEVDAWVRGQRPAAKRVIVSRRALGPFSFKGRDYIYDLELAHDFSRNRGAAAAAICDPAFDEWLRTGLRDSAVSDGLAKRLADGPGRQPADPVTEATLVLDPFGPIRSDALAAAPDGFEPVLAAAFSDENRARQNDIAALLASDLPGQWMALRNARAPRNAGGAAHLTAVQALAEDSALGLGAERCLYELNKALPCQSPLVARNCVTDVPDLMTALNKAAARSDAAIVFLDRHVAAFAASRSSAAETILLRVAPAGSSTDKRVVALEFFSEVQSRFNCGPLNELAKAFAAQLGTMADDLHGRTRRKQIKEVITAAKAAGDLTELFIAVRAVTNDESNAKNFRRAAVRYAALQTEIDDLKADDSYAVRMGDEIGGRAATALSLVFLVLSAALAVFGIGL